MIDISVIIVTWNSANDIVKCIESIYYHTSSASKLNTETIVIDNYSQDGTIKLLTEMKLPNFRIIFNKSNKGFTQAANEGISNAQGKFIMLLNPDTELKDGSICRLYDFLVHNPDYAAAAPLLLNEDGSIQYSIRNFPTYWAMYCEFYFLAYIFPKSALFGKWKMKYFKYNEDTDVNQPMAAAIMLRKEFLDKYGIMDDRFIMFFSDVDLCRNIIDHGQKIRFLPSAVVLHRKGTSIYKDRIRNIRTWRKDCIQYFKKYHYNPLFLIWLRISLKISEIFRILYYKIIIK
jgi:GT2 family glycosyltransferase